MAVQATIFYPPRDGQQDTSVSATALSTVSVLEVDDTSAARTITLPAAITEPRDRQLIVKDTYGLAGTNNITITTTGLTPDVDTLTWHLSGRTTATQAVAAMSDAALAAVTASGTGVGKTLTADANGALTIDGVAVAATNIVLIKNQANTVDNGIYTVTDAGSGGTPFILTRRTTFDQIAEVLPGYTANATAGTVNNGLVYSLDGGIDDATTATISTNFGTATFYSDGTNWRTAPLLSTALASTVAGTITVDDATNTATTNILTLTHTTTGTAAAGIGAGLVMASEDAGGTAQNTAIVRAVLTTATAGSEIGAFRVSVVNAGTVPAEASEQLQIAPTNITTIADSALTATTQDVFTFRHRTSGTPAAGIGAGLILATEDAGGADQTVANVRAVLTTATAGSEVGAFRVGLVSGGTSPTEGNEQLQVTAAGGITVIAENSATTTATDVITIRSRSSGTPAAGIGANITVATEDGGGADQTVSTLRHTLTTVTAGSEVGAVRLSIVGTPAGTVPAAGSEQHQWSPTNYLVNVYSANGNTPLVALGSTSDGLGCTSSGNVQMISGGALRCTFGASVFDLNGYNIGSGASGTKFGTASTQLLGFWNAAVSAQPAAQADASGGAVIDVECRAATNGLLAKLRTIGIIAT